MYIVEREIITNRTLDMVERAVQMVCSYMPAKVAEPCEQFVDKYGDEIVKLIVDAEMNPKAVCSALTLCFPHHRPHHVSEGGEFGNNEGFDEMEQSPNIKRPTSHWMYVAPFLPLRKKVLHAQIDLSNDKSRPRI